jgi:hypothetical protein
MRKAVASNDYHSMVQIYQDESHSINANPNNMIVSSILSENNVQRQDQSKGKKEPICVMEWRMIGLNN